MKQLRVCLHCAAWFTSTDGERACAWQRVRKKSINKFALYRYCVFAAVCLVSGLVLRLKVSKPGHISLPRSSVLEQDTEQSTRSLTGGRCEKERLR